MKCIFSGRPVSPFTAVFCDLHRGRCCHGGSEVSSHLRIGQRVWRAGPRRSSYVDALRSSGIIGGTSACTKDAVEAAALRAVGRCPGHLPPQPGGPAARSRAELRTDPQQCATSASDPQPRK